MGCGAPKRQTDTLVVSQPAAAEPATEDRQAAAGGKLKSVEGGSENAGEQTQPAGPGGDAPAPSKLKATPLASLKGTSSGYSSDGKLVSKSSRNSRDFYEELPDVPDNLFTSLDLTNSIDDSSVTSSNQSVPAQ
eukprot:SAG22_NODE_7281_length_755_cov_1.016768_1_plen_134_part_00